MPIRLAGSGRLSKKIDMRWIVGIGLLVISFASPWNNTFLLSLSGLGNWSRRKRAIHVVFYRVTFFSCCIALGHLISRARLAPLI
ncbi:hypothetical protein B0O99DRAFT_634437 [Bisporella sp. PMI_857]|nr:hypothetical protein B0O99DRAFT_634437 [Bisporella sp. PMI_857]